MRRDLLIMVLASLGVLLGSPPAFAQLGYYALADRPQEAKYPATAYYNPAGGVTVFRGGVGKYLVRFYGLGQYKLGLVQVAAYGPSVEYCKWSGNLRVEYDAYVIDVNCYSPDGSRADSRFTVLLGSPSFESISSRHATLRPVERPQLPEPKRCSGGICRHSYEGDVAYLRDYADAIRDYVVAIAQEVEEIRVEINKLAEQ